ncbi:MAG: 3'-5' exonuclease [Ferruginibacter sp.]
MKPDKILFIDTETGGLDPFVNSLLSIAFVVWQNFNIIDTKEIFINDGILNVTSQALEINGIDIVNHSNISVTPEIAINQIESFLELHFEKDEKITLGGHNINFDVNFFKHFLSKNHYTYHKRFSHRIVDTATILYYLYLGGKIKQKTISSTEAFNIFGIVVNKRHSAIGDAIATAELFTILLRIISNNAKVKNSIPIDLPKLFK